MIPDVEAAVVQFLLNNENVTDALGDENRVSTELPREAALPRLRITLGGGSIAVQRHLYAPRLTVEAWADDKATAFEAVRVALHELETGLTAAQVEEGVVTSCELDTGLLWAPDQLTEKARYLGSITVYIHPHPTP